MAESRKLSERVIQCAQNISRGLGAGFLERVYENALCIELRSAGIEYRRQQEYSICYRNENIGTYIADIVVCDKLLIELKALSAFSKDHEAQVLNYLKVSGLTVGLLLNFGVTRLGIRRVVLNYSEQENI